MSTLEARWTSERVEKSLSEWVGNERTAILAGHFGLDCRKQSADNAGVECRPDIYHEGFGPVTWRIGCNVVAHQPADARLVIVVNDWQLTRHSAPSGMGVMTPSLAVRARREFYDKHPTPPSSYIDYLESLHLADALIEKHSNGQWLFSEADLRDKFAHRVANLVRREPDAHRLRVRPGSRPTIVLDAGGSEICLSVGGSSSCVGTIAELMLILQARGIHRLAMMIPEACFPQVDNSWRTLDELFPELSFAMMSIAFRGGITESSAEFGVIVSQYE